jgi:hypothetical protein
MKSSQFLKWCFHLRLHCLFQEWMHLVLVASGHKLTRHTSNRTYLFSLVLDLQFGIGLGSQKNFEFHRRIVFFTFLIPGVFHILRHSVICCRNAVRRNQAGTIAARLSHLVLILILVFVDPSPAMST